MKQVTTRRLGTLFVTAFLPVSAFANECSSVRFAEVGWTDITATTALASEVLEALGYEPRVDTVSLTQVCVITILMCFWVTGCRRWPLSVTPILSVEKWSA